MITVLTTKEAESLVHNFVISKDSLDHYLNNTFKMRDKYCAIQIEAQKGEAPSYELFDKGLSNQQLIWIFKGLESEEIQPHVNKIILTNYLPDLNTFFKLKKEFSAPLDQIDITNLWIGTTITKYDIEKGLVERKIKYLCCNLELHSYNPFIVLEHNDISIIPTIYYEEVSNPQKICDISHAADMTMAPYVKASLPLKTITPLKAIVLKGQ